MIKINNYGNKYKTTKICISIVNKITDRGKIENALKVHYEIVKKVEGDYSQLGYLKYH